MKTTIERIFETLSKEKVELKSEKIELGALDDLEKKTKKAIDSFNSVNASARKAGQIIDKAEGEAKKLGKVFEKLTGDWAKIEKTAKELGFKLPSKTTSLLRDASAYRSISQNAASQLEKASSIVYGLDD